MLEKVRNHALGMNFKKHFLICIILGVIALAGFSVASHVVFSREEAAWEQQMQSQQSSSSSNNNSSTNKRAGRHGGRDDDWDSEEMWDNFDEPELSTADKVLMVSGGIVGAVLGIWYWILCMIWAYRKSRKMGVNSAIAVWGTFFFNLIAIAVLYVYGWIRGTCYHCGKIRHKGELYCARCGAPFTRDCPNCGKPVDIHDVYCPHCGERITTPPEAPEPEDEQ